MTARARDPQDASGPTGGDVERVVRAAEAFASGGSWGEWKAFIVHGPPTKEEGIAASREITRLQVALDAALAALRLAPAATPPSEAATAEHSVDDASTREERTP